jgi:hypothetical protein
VRGKIMRTVFIWRNKQADDIKKDNKKTGYQNRMWRELALNRVQWWALVFAVLYVRVVPAVTEPLETALCNTLSYPIPER